MLSLRIALPTLLAALLLVPAAAACPPGVTPLVEDACGTPPPPGPVGDACVFLGGADALAEDAHAFAREWLDQLP